ncbi:2-amino-3-carboxymuconate-6-semialdehyde decarboxylase [Aspergillus udagawae]|uniref:6-methylsalicylate decarboxylase n=1 Tax=Aspergillus udagawae TaxID=91492 RepID=A0ABQ1BCM4_9EURO|nr:2-amino-3-carboxymuconate-6-semialdehyde decarboxylase [Aspergillus udagawae]GFF60598.1 2-amino-3-carboxymuconate-6-semialdehyde decarboxylase [Aspergillus udagawae]GFF98591.1 2-amino-3-carboxymuconate-6-semialdehyde decarboxylase [Aspergillus udagawae]GFG19044.1 2-amino-3-carboxymuconate-6-semialdehyde decarboxylase [Aspergillus udagawae]
MPDHLMDWLQDKALGWSYRPPVNKVDTHHHFVPPFYRKGSSLACMNVAHQLTRNVAVEDAGGDPSGWPTPHWSATRSELLMNRLGVQTAILSVTAPGACILKGTASFALARQLNEYAAELRDRNPQRFGFFASLPSLLDTDATLSEIAYALDTLHADGVTLFTRYGDSNVYLGHRSLEPIWAELDRRKCVVFMHPTHPVDTTPVNPKMPQPVVDYPHETTRSAMDMILQGTRSKYPNCKVILSHAGGALPYLISRVATPMRRAPDVAASYRLGTTYEQVMRDFRSFYYDLALSSSPQVLDMALKTIPRDHLLYGSDFPYAPAPAYPGFLEDLESYEMEQELRDMINFGNATKLIPRLARGNERNLLA